MLVHAQPLSHFRTLCDPMDCSLQGSSVYGFFQDTGSVATSSSRGSSNLGIELTSPTSPGLAADCLPLSHLGGLFNRERGTGLKTLLYCVPSLPGKEKATLSPP